MSAEFNALFINLIYFYKPPMGVGAAKVGFGGEEGIAYWQGRNRASGRGGFLRFEFYSVGDG